MSGPAPARVIADGGATTPAGFSAGAVYCGLKTPGPDKLDIGILASDRPANVAAVYTRNAFAAAPVAICKAVSDHGTARGVVVNAGNANACTGQQGLDDAREMAALTAKRIGASADEVFVASTGVIGVPLPMDLVRKGISEISLAADGGPIIARAIMTTDTRPKQIAVQLTLAGKTVTVGGMVKGAAMIHPNMATMLAFITTDAAVDVGLLRSALPDAVADSFNMISVDGDTSTNDTVIVLANGAAGNTPVKDGPDAEAFRAALTQVAAYLAREIVGDAEGATRIITCEVKGARDKGDARRAARQVISSMLVKSAVYGSDPNWGRVLCAIGYSGASVDPMAVDLDVGGVALVRAGAPVETGRDEAAEVMKQREVRFVADLHVGTGSAVAWGCDLTEEYVVLNSAYTT
ncbi:MAG: bifunctional glutamate N-acetyltransferase/amino-acid acetyltransferase ArgJ [Chloroflexota bacterium]